MVYTVSDFSPGADSCINMLFDSMKLDSDTDFKIIATKHPGGKFKHEVIIAPLPKGYPGFLKSSENVPSGYDYYIYLDSDIFCFNDPKTLINPDKDFSVVFEEMPMIDRWYAYDKAPREDKVKMQSILGMNAGTFCFRDISFLGQIRGLWLPWVQYGSSTGVDARLEQSSFNYAICQRTGFDLSKCNDVTPSAQLQAAVRPYDPNKFLYHFTGAPNTMAGKAYVMSEFLKNNENLLS